MATTPSAPQVGPLLREWRQRRRLTQLELALDAGVSARHLSFVETGRSKPGRDMLLRLGERLEVPFRERNRLLLAAGHAPAFPERPFGAPELAPVREALERILKSHEPYPAVVFDRYWNLVAANAAIQPLVAFIDPALLSPPVNVLRVAMELIPQIINANEVMAYFRDRIARQLATTADEQLAELLAEFETRIPHEGGSAASESDFAQSLGPVRVHAPGGGEWSFFGMFGTFDMPFEVTISELAIEMLFPADSATADAFTSFATAREER
ncbi:transcriptional regulator with XRE-family HTH domain [Mycolicibacterium sp. BK556]|uniref:helix-turn-helix domain-containing protein n=1 Tax=Mycobacteriaceae TaxID=1762 RepID=UPI00105D4A51|nr:MULTISPECIES: helix-turn-helix transcriptional regulator [Mycobacteriaceae]MBB3602038.1 transcriptional regulator with XRE-family HTH domain [Mycolicibacterium sp. BK556]MBB3631790.1 transcriptional regulator with XRE-family HTH domain [Mycolicibacterium sp. BK607]MBB3749794.1 transcriptional regulator with XRE-family HTH domain [Mycolicibacterium sp. BK634]TDO18919.1 transcriptional regulator with XRE-family HTH domain [Mycobacterium sp. BK086]